MILQKRTGASALQYKTLCAAFPVFLLSLAHDLLSR